MKNIVLIACLALTLTACVASQSARKETANRIAAPAFMIDRELQAGEFTLTIFERIHDRGGIAQIYIEGDNPKGGTLPTPQTPLALQLAARDKSQNVIAIARPCQYSNRKDMWKQDPDEGSECPLKYSQEERFAPEIIASYNIALDEIKRRWGITAFNIYGHSGGGTIATLLAAERTDIMTLTTISGILDHQAYSNAMLYNDKRNKHFKAINATTPNPINEVARLTRMPQYHYIGGADDVTAPAALHNYLTALGPNNCAQYKIIEENGYTSGWVDKWPTLLADKPKCN